MRLLTTLLAYAAITSCLRADVTQLLTPLDLSVLRPVKTGVTRAGFVSPTPASPRSYTARISVVASVVSLDAVTLESRIAAALAHRYQASGDVGTRLSREWKPLEVPAEWEFRLHQSIPDELCSNAFLRFSIWANGRELGEWGYPVKCSHMVDVAWTKAVLSRGNRIALDALASRSMDILSLNPGFVRADARLNGYQVATSLKPGAMLKWNHLSKVTLVRKGQVVNVYASGKGIFVEMKGQAMEDGVEGSFVRIRNLSSKREFQAKVLNENSVKVYF